MEDVSFHKITEQENAVMRNHTYLQNSTQVYHLFKGIPNFSAHHTKSIFHVSIVLVHKGQQSVVNHCEGITVSYLPLGSQA